MLHFYYMHARIDREKYYSAIYGGEGMIVQLRVKCHENIHAYSIFIQ